MCEVKHVVVASIELNVSQKLIYREEITTK
jgi:hypothetical protein